MPSQFEYLEKRGDVTLTKIIILNKIANIDLQEQMDRSAAKILFVGGAEKELILPREVMNRFLKELRAYLDKH
jgi:hypothetical protein